MDDDFTTEVFRRLPLASATMELLRFVTEENFLEQVYQQHRGSSYTKIITFPLLVNLVADTLLEHEGSAHRTFQHAQQQGTLQVSTQASYRKLGAVPIGLSLGFFQEANRRLDPLYVGFPSSLPLSMRRFRVLACDGKKIKHLAKRLKPLRGLNGTVLGGKLLAVVEVESQRVVAVTAEANGLASDNVLLPAALDPARAATGAGPRLFVADRIFCDSVSMKHCAQHDDHFVIRYATRFKFHRDETKAVQTGVDDNGLSYREEWGHLGSKEAGTYVAVRRITLTRPDAEPLILVTDLLDGQAYPAADVLAVYRRRWEIETLFLEVTQTYQLRHLIGSTPQATVFQAVFCLLLANLILLIKQHVALGQDKTPAEISSLMLFNDVVREKVSLFQLLGRDGVVAHLVTLPWQTPEQLWHRLQTTVQGRWDVTWSKTVASRKRGSKTPPHAYLKGGSNSVYNIVAGRCDLIPLTPEKRRVTPTTETG